MLSRAGSGCRSAFRSAVTAYYRSQFLNVTLPGGVVGDVHRAVDHGRARGQLGRSVRAVAWERTAGQVVQIVLSVVVLLAVASPVHGSLVRIVGWGVLAAVAVRVVIALLARHRGPGSVRSWVGADLRTGVLAPTNLAVGPRRLGGGGGRPRRVVRRGGPDVDSTVSVGRILPVAVLVVLASALPLNVAGWGPREGVAAWAFGAAGLGNSARRDGVGRLRGDGAGGDTARCRGAGRRGLMHAKRRQRGTGGLHAEPARIAEVIHV